MLELIRRLPIRLRLALAFALVMAIVLAAMGSFVYYRLAGDLDSSVDQSLEARAGDIARLLRAGDGRVQATAQVEGIDETFSQVLDLSGRVLAAPAGLHSHALLTPRQIELARRGTVRVERVEQPGLEEPARLLARPVIEVGGRRVVMVVGAPLDDRDEALASLATLLTIGGAGALLLASLAGYMVAAAALRPVESMRRTAADVSVARPGRRLPVPPARDEISRLGETLNEMLGRQEAAFQRERAFVSDASHELRTPLAILRTELELALRNGRTPAELRAAVGSAAEETERLHQLAEDLLVIARSEEGRLPVALESVSASELLDRVRVRFAARVRLAGRDISVDAPDGLRLVADPLRLEQALANLVENALRHGAGEIELAAHGAGGEARLHVRDRGPGFPPGFAPRAFQRFSRGDGARTAGGAGLGLAIVLAIAEAHGRGCGAESREGGGADVWIELPAGSSSSHPAPVDNRESAQPQEETT